MPKYHAVGSVAHQQNEVLQAINALTGRLDALESRGGSQKPAESAKPEPSAKSKRKWTEEVLSERDEEVDKSHVQHTVDELIVYRRWKKLDTVLSKIPQDARLPMLSATRVKLITTDFKTGKQKSALSEEDIKTMKVLAKWGAPVVIHQQEVVEAP